MIALTTILFFLGLIGLILGLIKPSLVIFWGEKEKKNRKRSSLYYGLLALVFMIISISITPTDTASTASTTTPKVSEASTSTDTNVKDKDNEEDAKKAAEDKAKKESDRKAKEKADQEAKAKADKEAADKAAAEAKKKAEALKHSGTGDKVTEVFSVDPGFVVFDSSHTGSSNFAVELLDENGKQIDLLVNTIGNYKGKTLAYLPNGGKYILKIQADGKWTFNGSQEIPTNPPSAPTTLSGHGDDVKFVKMNSGLRRFKMTHKGESNFVVQVNGQSLLANEIGNYSGETAQQVQDDGVYAFSINADGDWTINIK